MAEGGSHKKKNPIQQNIKVVVRVRPLNDEEKQKRAKIAVQCASMQEIHTKDKKYQFDRVFEPSSTQIDVYTYVVAPMIKDVLAGYNCTVFAYGQTGTGKTHTMTSGHPTLGSNLDWRTDQLAGCIPRAAANIFDEIGLMNVTDYNVRVSFLELYNEEVRDLLKEDVVHRLPLSIFNDSKGSVCIQNLSEVTVFNSNDIYLLLQKGTLLRQTAATLTNNHSSRSHTVFTITVHIKETDLSDEEVLRTGKINLVDLAGSENISRSGAKDKRAQELANINRSLLTLGRVIQILSEKNKYVPYRDSKLTRILQDSLGGHTKTCIIATISPSHMSYDVTQSTLDYACRARDIKNTPTLNEKVTKAVIVKEMTCEIEKLKKDLDAAREGSGFFINRETWDQLNSQVQSNSHTLNLKNEIIEAMKKKLSDLEVVRDIKIKEHEDAMEVCSHKEKIIEKTKNILKEQKACLRQEQYISQCYLEAAKNNNSQARELFDVTNHLSRNQNILQRKLENQYFNNHKNEQVIKEKATMLNDALLDVLTTLDNVNSATSSTIAKQQENVHASKTACNEYAMKARTAWAEESLPLLESKFNEHSQLVKASTESSCESISKAQKNINEMLTLLDHNRSSYAATHEEVKILDESESARTLYYEDSLNTFYSQLLKIRQRKEEDLQLLKCEIDELNVILERFDKISAPYRDGTKSREDEIRKLRIWSNFDDFKQRQELLSQMLQSTEDSLNLQRQRFSESGQTLIANNQRIQEHIEEVFDKRLNMDAAFVQHNTLLVESLERDTDTLKKSIEHHISEVKTIFHTADEIGANLVSNIIPVKKEGDTPKQTRLDYLKPIDKNILARDALIKKFQEEYSEDAPNEESCRLNETLEFL